MQIASASNWSACSPIGPGSASANGVSWVRVAYAKVAEFQASGLVHLHVIVRLDGAKDRVAPPGVRVSADERARRSAALSEEKSVVMIEGIAKEIG